MAIKSNKSTPKKQTASGSGTHKKSLVAVGGGPVKPVKKKPAVLVPKQFDQTLLKLSCKALLRHSHAAYLKLAVPAAAETPAGPGVRGDPIYLNINTFDQITAPSTTKQTTPTLIPVPNRVRPKLSDLQVSLIVEGPQTDVVQALNSSESLPTFEMFADIVSAARLRSALAATAAAAAAKNGNKEGAKSHPHKAAAEYVKRFDVVVCDARLSTPAMRSLLGPRVYTKPSGVKIHSPFPITLQPIPGPSATPVQIEAAKKVVADPAVVKKQLKYIAGCVTVLLTPGTSMTVLVGLSSFTMEQLIENITAVLKVILDPGRSMIEGGWENVRSMNIKTTESAALPLYLQD